MIDMMGDTVWSDRDITLRAEAMIREHFSLEDELILIRKQLGALLGLYIPTPADADQLANFQAILLAAQTAADNAREDNALLAETLELEEAQVRLARPVDPDNADDSVEREEAQAVVDAAGAAALALAEGRLPHVSDIDVVDMR